MKLKERFKNIKWDYYLIAILILATFLYTWKLWNVSSSNDFYTASIVSMTQSFKNFWYASFDPAGFITVDKPPVALWFMAISAKTFGVSTLSVALPSIIFGIGSVYLIYRIVANRFPVLAARIAALTMTITPIVVADSRSNNMDSTLVFFLLLSIYFVQKAVMKSRQRYLWIGMALIGIAFNVKMLQAFMILPAVYLYYCMATKFNWKIKLRNLAVATGFLVFFTLLWPLSVDMTNANNRPYEGGSEHNSVLELAFGYNGSQRLLGQSTGIGGTFPGLGNSTKKGSQPTGKSGKKPKLPSGKKSKNGAPKPPSNNSNKAPQPPNGTKKGNPPTLPSGKSGKKPSGTPPTKPNGKKSVAKGGAPNNIKKMKKMNNPAGGQATGGNAGGAFNIGNKGPLRIFQSELGPQISWMLPFAILGLISAFIYYRKRQKIWQLGKEQTELVMWTSWLVPVAGFFSVAGFFHPYYTIMLAPPIAALTGIGCYTMYKQWSESSRGSRWLLSIAIVMTTALQTYYLLTYYKIWPLILAMTGVILAGVMMLGNFNFKKVMIVVMTTIFVAPAWWSLTPTLGGVSQAIPFASPSLIAADETGTAAGGMGDGSVDQSLLKYVNKHAANAKYLFATDDSSTAAPYIIKTGKAVMALGGYNGTDPAITLKQFKQLVKTGELKYYYSGGMNQGTPGSNGTLYDLSKIN